MREHRQAKIENATYPYRFSSSPIISYTPLIGPSKADKLRACSRKVSPQYERTPEPWASTHLVELMRLIISMCPKSIS